jgi:hypothetical protein
MHRIRNRLTYANVMVTVLAFIVLGGGAYAAFHLPKNSVKSRNIKNGQVKRPDLAANAVNGAKVANGSLTGADVAEGSLGVVPSAGVANHAYSTSVASKGVPAAYADAGNPIASLAIPQAGNYVINAKLDAHNGSSTPSNVDECALGTGTSGAALEDLDETEFDVDGVSADDSEVVALQAVHHFASSGQVRLNCRNGGGGSVTADNVKLTAVDVGALTGP